MPEECVVRAKGLPDMELAIEANTEGADDVIVGLPIAAVGGLILFSFCLLKYKLYINCSVKKINDTKSTENLQNLIIMNLRKKKI